MAYTALQADLRHRLGITPPTAPNPPPTAASRPPGLRQRDEAVLHSTGGEVCGGDPDSKLVAKLLPQFKTDFLDTDDVFEWIKKKRAFFDTLRITMSRETLYTMVSVFTIKAPTLRKVWDPLLDKESFFTSFEHFMKIVEQRQFPNCEDAGYVVFDSRRQASEESVRQFWMAYEDLAKMVKTDPKTHFNRFLNGVLNYEVRKIMRVEWSKTHDVESVISVADSMEAAIKMEKLMKKDATEAAKAASTKAATATVASTTASKTKPPGKKPPVPPKPKNLKIEDSQISSTSPTSEQSSESSAPPTAQSSPTKSKGRKSGRGRGRGKNSSSPSLAEMVVGIMDARDAAKVSAAAVTAEKTVEDRLRGLTST